jgi:hypothetical protein
MMAVLAHLVFGVDDGFQPRDDDDHDRDGALEPRRQQLMRLHSHVE